jgi:uncharacterized protein (TIGR01777 family)
LKHAVLITGASGLIGSRLTAILLQKGCRVSHLGRAAKAGLVPSYVWNPETGYLDPKAFEGIDTLIHLAGAGIGDKRWSVARKREILESRVRSTALLVDFLRSNQHGVSTIIAASAIGYYGFGTDDQEFTEGSAAGKDFLASVVVRWEQETERFRELGCRVVKPRIGVVLSAEGGALREIIRPIRWGVGAPLGTGNQVVSWIHIDDLCEFFAYALENPHMEGVYNVVAPKPVTNRELTVEIARQLRRKVWLPPVPSFALRLLLGEMADLVVKGSNITSTRITESDFKFRFPQLQDAIGSLLKQNG